MAATFPTTSKKGYAVDEVEEFLEEARRAYTAPAGESSVITADYIRTLAFSMKKGGYQPSSVDAALERLEDAFASREREHEIAQHGDQAWYGKARSTAQAILDRLVRPHGRRFRRVSIFTVGYSVRDVDALADRVTDYFQHGKALTVDDLRTSVFASQRGGYSETQVDVVVDAVVDVMLAVR